MPNATAKTDPSVSLCQMLRSLQPGRFRPWHARNR